MTKGQIFRSILFVVICVAIFLVVQFYLTCPEDYRNNEWIGGFFEEEPETLDAVYLGSSEVYAFFQPPLAWDKYGIAVHNFTSNSQPFEAAKYIIEECRKTQPNAVFIIDTKQLIKNYTNKKEVTVVRKYYEILSALNLEKNYDKDTIIEAYLNTLYLGSGCYGVKTASQKYFGKDVSELNAAECAVIASITQAPTKYNPLLNPEHNRDRQLYCLKQMYEEHGFLTKEEYDEACAFELIFTNSENYVPKVEENAVKEPQDLRKHAGKREQQGAAEHG